ncbi:MAG: hypothetical protein QOG18_1657 [Microbacteriaceae bacterium]|jgi:uncharacterized membrane-anchored protein|nr:hypothetical protein [Microbacteriaceae bacterium]MDQ1527044.1 hypothetical protein [Microbacteriaceae bacterium]
MSRAPQSFTGVSRVPNTDTYFWVAKALSTALGEACSDFLVRSIGPVPAVLIGFVAFVVAMVIQFTRRRYQPWSYWLAVVMVGIFGTMAADVLHVGFGVPYAISATGFAVVLAAVFITWKATEKTLSIHAITSTRREVFYWLAVISTFALGTAAGDLTAIVFHLGYLFSAVLFAVIILIPALYFSVARKHPILTFWFAYVVTRPLGASMADWLGKPVAEGGIGVGSGVVTAVLFVVIAAIVGYISVRSRGRYNITPAR